MTSLIGILLSWLLLYKYLLLFGIFFLSALALPLPGNTLLLASGAFASQGYMNFWLAFSATLLANVLGDVAGYLLTVHYGERVIDKMRLKRSYLRAMENFVARHPRSTIVISRFGGTLDPVVNVLSGLGDVSFRTFIAFDVIGNFCSLLIVITAGYYLGDNWQSFSGIFSTIGWFLFTLLAAFGVLVIFRRQIGLSEMRFMKHLKTRIRRILERLNEY